MMKHGMTTRIQTVARLACVLTPLSGPVVLAADIPASTDAQFHAALRVAKPGDHIRLGVGPYKGGFYAVGLSGTVAQPIRISGPAADKPAVFAAETTGVLQLVQATHIEIENIHITRAKGNALAFDDGGKLDFSCHHITIRHVRIEDIGPEGTANAIKLAGVADFAITDGALVRFNTIYQPRKWAFRILQETVRHDFTPSRNGRIEDNVTVFKSTQWFEGGINIGPHTAPETFTFARNAWFCVDAPAKSRPTLPSIEKAPLVGSDPLFADPARHDFSLRPRSPAKGKGHTAWKDKPE